jgi:pilus assembly protein Flp/PilA
MMLRFLEKLRRDEVGATAIEYGLIAGLVSILIVGALNTINSEMTEIFEYISSNIDQALL